MIYQILTQYADLLWLPLVFVMVERSAWFVTCALVVSCALLLRLQVELLEQIGFANGIFGLMDTPIFQRGQVTYGLFILVYLVLAHFSGGTSKTIHLAASIATMITAFCVSTLVMVV